MHLSWFAVKSNDSMPMPPAAFHGWRRKGFGLFMMKCIIKYVYANQLQTKACDVYLQCVESQSFNFYSTIGFVQINRTYDDGFELLPKHLQRCLVNESNPSREPGQSLFHFFTRKSGTKTAPVDITASPPVNKKKGRTGKKTQTTSTDSQTC